MFHPKIIVFTAVKDCSIHRHIIDMVHKDPPKWKGLGNAHLS